MVVLIKLCLCLICSQNKTLQTLWLDRNHIGDAGAASISGALACVTLSRVVCIFVHEGISLAPPYVFRIDNYQGFFVRWFAAKTRLCLHWVSMATTLAMLGPLLLVLALRTSPVSHSDKRSFVKTILAPPYFFFRIDNGHCHGVMLFIWQPKHVSDGIAPLLQPNRWCRRV